MMQVLCGGDRLPTVWAVASLLIMLCFAACGTPSEPVHSRDAPLNLSLPAGFPAPPIPANNPLTVKKVELGRRLFFEKKLSSNGKVSCSSCHLPERAFSDTLPTSVGVSGRAGLRNAPSLTNVAYNGSYFWSGGALSLEAQAISAIENKEEMNGQFPEIIAWLTADASYRQLFEEAFQSPPTFLNILDAIAAFERTLISGNSRYDRFQRGDSSALNDSEKRGMQLFFSERTNCFRCHGGFNFTTNEFHDNGSQAVYRDVGRYSMTFRPSDKGKFKTPTLRNVALTAPYFHDGSMPTLADVVEHYNRGGAGSPNQSPLVRPLGLSAQEKQDLVNFLNALTDEDFIRAHQRP
ncbi:MAG: cytochrome-c peroxidase [Candidatus Thermochlorobacter aerophilum]|jgi:cytochrome c peroxidase|uniref:Methylamine utilization protein MauG n=1 Tax=Candidatus Thermochlorobacter aerophilus TaxID=1868324 RepID=A0A395M037_9BACT|nr:MAG: cytochrome-c peroxidase [Candidatus Thermochlorobacter aerophilum]